MSLRLVVFLVGAALAPGCSCNKSGALNEKPPDELPTQGLVIDQPAEGATLTGAWTTVSGWASPDWVQGVLVIGAPVDGFYLPSGHVGVPSVPVTFRKDGRFFAPRVPLQDGEVKLTLVPVGKGGSTYQPVTRTVTASGTAAAPATLVVDPPMPEPGKKATLRATTGENLSTPFQWDFDGDGTFDEEGASVMHAWDEPGRYQVTARTRVNDRWVSAFALVVVEGAPAVLASAAVDNPSRIFFLSADTYAQTETISLPDGGVVPRDLVAVVDGDLVRVFSPDLKPRFTLTGLSRPSGVARDREGRILVADTGHDRLVRFTPSGELDPSFGSSGEFRGGTQPMRHPISITFDGREVLCEDGTILQCDYREVPNCPRTRNDSLKRHLSKLGVDRVERYVFGPHSDKDDEELFFLASGRFFAVSSVGAHERAAERPVIDAVRGRTLSDEHYATVDERGRVHIYRWPWHEGPFTLAYPATTVAADRAGRLYVGGPGVVELRDFEPLK